jgi:Xaa-Pro dipeptidase
MSLDPLRDARTREAMHAHNLDALVCRLPENVLLLTGYWPLSSFAFALVPRAGPSALIAVNTEEAAIPGGAVDEVRTFAWGVVSAVDPYGDVQRHLSALIRSAGLERGRIGYEGSFEAVAPGHMTCDAYYPSGSKIANTGRLNR